MTTIRDVIEESGYFEHGGNPDDTAETWAASGFEGDTVAFEVSDGDLEVEEARDLLGVT